MKKYFITFYLLIVYLIGFAQFPTPKELTLEGEKDKGYSVYPLKKGTILFGATKVKSQLIYSISYLDEDLKLQKTISNVFVMNLNTYKYEDLLHVSTEGMKAEILLYKKAEHKIYSYLIEFPSLTMKQKSYKVPIVLDKKQEISSITMKYGKCVINVKSKDSKQVFVFDFEKNTMISDDYANRTDIVFANYVQYYDPSFYSTVNLKHFDYYKNKTIHYQLHKYQTERNKCKLVLRDSLTGKVAKDIDITISSDNDKAISSLMYKKTKSGHVVYGTYYSIINPYVKIKHVGNVLQCKGVFFVKLTNDGQVVNTQTNEFTSLQGFSSLLLNEKGKIDKDKENYLTNILSIVEREDESLALLTMFAYPSYHTNGENAVIFDGYTSIHNTIIELDKNVRFVSSKSALFSLSYKIGMFKQPWESYYEVIDCKNDMIKIRHITDKGIEEISINSHSAQVVSSKITEFYYINSKNEREDIGYIDTYFHYGFYYYDETSIILWASTGSYDQPKMTILKLSLKSNNYKEGY